jgi:hypothetical protein
VPDPHNLGYPLAEMDSSGTVITKLDGTGGAVDLRTTRTQLYYEIHDPTRYLTPDVTADFSEVGIEEIGPNRVRVSGARGSQWPDTLKVLVGVDLGFKVIGEVSYGGPGCVERAQRAEEICRRRLEAVMPEIDEIRFDLQGLNSLFGNQMASGYPAEVRLRMGVRTTSREVAQIASYEIEGLWFGPAGGGGITSSIVPALAVTSAYVPRELVRLDCEVVTV